MLKGLYTAYTGMVNEQNRMDILTNNLANSATTGFKKEGATSEGFSQVLTYRIKDLDTATGQWTGVNIGIGTPGVKIGETYTDFAQGAFRSTGNRFDLALSGSGFFNIEYTSRGGENKTMFTRDGSFTLTKEGFLVTKDGDYVLGTNQNGGTERIQIDPAKETSIDSQGRIVQDFQVVGQIKVSDFTDYNYLEHFGENMYTPVEGAEEIEGKASIQSGYLEASNVSVVTEMVNLISVTRQYESNQKIIQAYDQSLEIAVNQLGKL